MEKIIAMRQISKNAASVSLNASLEERLERWSQPPGQGEIEKCERALRMVKNAINLDPKLSKMDIKVFAKGSYANRTNIPSDSDIDIGVLNQSIYRVDYPKGITDADTGLCSANYLFKDFSTDVANAIKNEFGPTQVSIDSKCIKVRSNSCRLDADIVPHFVFRRYQSKNQYIEGVSIITPEKLIINWPDQDYENGIKKNSETNKKYKGLVRILKSIRSEMEAESIQSATDAKSYLISCLIWNVPNVYFSEESYESILFGSLNYLIHMTSSFENVKEWGEINELKYLFRDTQPWRLESVNQFLKDAKHFMEQYQ